MVLYTCGDQMHTYEIMATKVTNKLPYTLENETLPTKFTCNIQHHIAKQVYVHVWGPISVKHQIFFPAVISVIIISANSFNNQIAWLL